MSYEASGLCHINQLLSNKDKTTLQQLILNLKGLIEETKEEKIFISLEKDTNGNFILFYKKKFHRDASTIAYYLVAVLLKQTNKNILYIFDLYYQTLAKEVIWNEDDIPKHREEQELDENLGNQLDWVEIMQI